MDLTVIWAGIIGFAVFAYVVMDGFDLGIGILFPSVSAGRERDDAMNAGEAGADYVMFGEPRPDGWTPPPEETLERAAWWAEIFQTPCVAYASSLDQIAPLAAAGADFVALGDALWKAASPETAAAEAAQRVAKARP